MYEYPQDSGISESFRVLLFVHLTIERNGKLTALSWNHTYV